MAVTLGLLTSGQLHSQPLGQLSGVSSRETQGADASKGLPNSAEEIAGALARVEARLNEVRHRIAAPKPTETAAVAAVAATPDELAERDQSLQQWAIALDQQGRYLRSLAEIRKLNGERDAEQEAWRGFVQTPTAAVTEQLADAVSAGRIEVRTARMLLSILEGEISRHSARLADSHKQLRLAKDSEDRLVAQDSRRQWLIQLAQLRTQADEASVESAEIGRGSPGSRSEDNGSTSNSFNAKWPPPVLRHEFQNPTSTVSSLKSTKNAHCSKETCRKPSLRTRNCGPRVMRRSKRCGRRRLALRRNCSPQPAWSRRGWKPVDERLNHCAPSFDSRTRRERSGRTGFGQPNRTASGNCAAGNGTTGRFSKNCISGSRWWKNHSLP
jgi:hypothetical protein